MQQKKREYEEAKIKIISFSTDVICTSDGYVSDIYDDNGWVDDNIIIFN